MALAICDHTVLPANRHKWTHSALYPQPDTSTRFTYPGGIEGSVDLGDTLRWLIRTQMVIHPNVNSALHGRESNPWPVDHKSDALNTTPPSHYGTCIKEYRHCGVTIGWLRLRIVTRDPLVGLHGRKKGYFESQGAPTWESDWVRMVALRLRIHRTLICCLKGG